MEEMIQEVDSPRHKVGPFTQVISVDGQSGRKISFSPLIYFKRGVKHYAITTDLVKEGEFTMILNSIDSSVSRKLHIQYKVSCKKGGEEMLASSLQLRMHQSGVRTSPYSALNSLIEQWVIEFNRDHPDAVGHYFDYRDDLIQHLKIKTGSIGLSASFSLTIENEIGKNTLIEVSTGFFPVSVTDSDEKPRLKLFVTLVIDEGNQSKAILHDLPEHELAIFIKKQVSLYTIDNVKLHDLTAVSKENLVTALKDLLNPELKARGWITKRLSLELEDQQNLEQLQEFEIPVECTLINYDEKVTVKHVLNVSVEDIAKTKDAGIVDLEGYVRSELEVLTKNEVFGNDYAWLLLQFNGDSIKLKMQDKMRQIGYSIRQFTSVPESPQRKVLKEGFTIVSDKRNEYLAHSTKGYGINTDDDPEEFATNKDQVPIRLQFIVEGEFRDFANVKPILTPTVSLELEIWKIIQKTIQRELHQTSPEDYYMNFSNVNVPDARANKTSKEEDQQKTADLPVQDILISKIKEALSEELNIICKEITLKPLETELIARADKLRRGAQREVKVMIVRPSDPTNGVPLTVEYAIWGVSANGWQKFKANDLDGGYHEFNKLEKIISEHLNTRLQGIGSDGLHQMSPKMQSDILNFLRGHVHKAIETHFGLNVEFTNVRLGWSTTNERAATLFEESEKAKVDSLIALIKETSSSMIQQQQKLKDRIFQLENSKTKLLVEGLADTEEIKLLEEQIEISKKAMNTLSDEAKERTTIPTGGADSSEDWKESLSQQETSGGYLHSNSGKGIDQSPKSRLIEQLKNKAWQSQNENMLVPILITGSADRGYLEKLAQLATSTFSGYGGSKHPDESSPIDVRARRFVIEIPSFDNKLLVSALSRLHTTLEIYKDNPQMHTNAEEEPAAIGLVEAMKEVPDGEEALVVIGSIALYSKTDQSANLDIIQLGDAEVLNLIEKDLRDFDNIDEALHSLSSKDPNKTDRTT